MKYAELLETTKDLVQEEREMYPHFNVDDIIHNVCEQQTPEGTADILALVKEDPSLWLETPVDGGWDGEYNPRSLIMSNIFDRLYKDLQTRFPS